MKKFISGLMLCLVSLPSIAEVTPVTVTGVPQVQTYNHRRPQINITVQPRSRLNTNIALQAGQAAREHQANNRQYQARQEQSRLNAQRLQANEIRLQESKKAAMLKSVADVYVVISDLRFEDNKDAKVEAVTRLQGYKSMLTKFKMDTTATTEAIQMLIGGQGAMVRTYGEIALRSLR